MSKKEKNMLYLILLSGGCLLATLFLNHVSYIQFACYIIAYLLVGKEVLGKALRNLLKGDVFDENFLMSLATVGAFFIGEYVEAVLVMLLYQIGELFQSYAVFKSRKSITSLMDIRPDVVNLEVDGKIDVVDPEMVSVGSVIVVKPGEKVALDGIVLEGTSFLDTSMLTGESLPRKVGVKDLVFSGCVNQNGVLRMKTTKKFQESTASKILELVEHESEKKATTEKFITKFARYYTPIVVVFALFLALILPLVTDLGFIDAMRRAMTFLVISCPCALVISIPLGFFGGIGCASKHGILLKGSQVIERLSKVRTIVFDKTGTLTRGSFVLAKVDAKDGDNERLLMLSAHAEYYSSHPIARAMKEGYGKKLNQELVRDVNEITGCGLTAVVDGKKVAIGNAKLMRREQIAFEEIPVVGTIVYVGVDGVYGGYFLIEDELKEDVKDALTQLRNQGVDRLVMLTGDAKEVANHVSSILEIDECHAELLPQDKVDEVEKLLVCKEDDHALAFVGDGMNDAPVLMRADVGIAMGALGSDAAIEASDVVVMDDQISKIPIALSISKRTIRIVKQNIYFALGVKFLFLLLGAFGITHMMGAVFADVGVSFLAILNSMRALSVKHK